MMGMDISSLGQVSPASQVPQARGADRSDGRMTQRDEARSITEIATEDAISSMDAMGDEMEDASIFLSEFSRRSERRGRSGSPAGKSLGRLAARLEEEDAAGAFPALELLPAVIEGKLDAEELAQMVRNSGELALLLSGAMIEMPDGRRRQALSDLLDECVSGDDWALELFAKLEFGGGAQAVHGELAAVLAFAKAGDMSLVALFERLQSFRQRSRKLKVMIRALGAQIGERKDDDKVKLASVNRDLKRLLLFMGLEEQCEYVARAALGDESLKEEVLRNILTIVDQPWPTLDWMQGHLRKQCRSDAVAYRYAVKIKALMQMLPNPCFNDDEHRSQIVTALVDSSAAFDEAD
jgi:hypothetical protein